MTSRTRRPLPLATAVASLAVVAGVACTAAAERDPQVHLSGSSTGASGSAGAGTAASVVTVSIDALNPRALRVLGRAATPTLHRLIDRGASTLNARTERELTLTLPNHTGMVTGRRVEASTGGHGVTWNDTRTTPATVQAAAGHQVDSVFTVLDQAGLGSAVFASKPKFSLWQRSWPTAIDKLEITKGNGALVRHVVADLSNPRAYRFVHLSAPDDAGHEHGFMSRRYLTAVKRTDRRLGRLVAAIDADPALRRDTVLVVTADHGGKGVSHSMPTVFANYRVPFIVRGPGVPAGTDLYDLNPDYRDPKRARTTYAGPQPVRNGDVANLVTSLLGLPAVPGSEHDAGQDLDVYAR
ncbi:alkaline phosphatase family protein [uncultured Nocardioides sp.]|uniref:alkaline phosphatase family protein n=1 Tax=uncultured Nocardioides sp. TaxID=198441 RepID=UPI0025CD31BA|nr:alkaline phosphatase family protein [uncultured Nocardioides sp.]